MFTHPGGLGRPFRHRWAVTPWLVALAFSGIGCDDTAGLARSRVAMDLNPAPSTLDFGEVVRGRTSAEPHIIRVRSVGDATLVLEDVAIVGDAGATPFTVSSWPKAVAPSSEKEIWVRFSPTITGVFEATLEIRSNDPARRIERYTLKGAARDPCAIEVTPSHSKLLLGQRQTLTIRALGSDCRITRLFTDELLFPFVDPPELPFVIPSGNSFDLTVQHVSASQTLGLPIREVLVKESEGQEVRVSLEGEPPVYGCVSIAPKRLLFDETAIGQLSSRTVIVENRCARDVFVTSGVVTLGAYFYAVDSALFPARVPARGAVEIPVSYSPFSPAGDDGVLVLSTNDAALPRFEVELYGRAAVPVADVFPSVLEFGTVVYKNPREDQRSECTSSTQFVQIYNEGATDLHVTALELDAAGDNHFEVTGVVVDGVPLADPSRVFSIGPGRNAKVSLQFAPEREAPEVHRSTLLIHHDAAGGLARVNLVGRAARDGAAHDVFTQLAGPKVDILWVIDDSCSMYDEQARLVQNLSQFVGYADTQNADWQMGVITTDGHSPYSGVLEECFPYPRVLTSRYENEATRERAFSCLFNVGTDGSGREAGLGAARNALLLAQSGEQDPLRNRNAGFLRADAKLAIVIMSDEDDQSDQGDELLRDFFFSVKRFRRDQVKVHAIAGPVAEPCQTGVRQAEPGYRYYWMSQETGGLYLNICLTDWQPVLRQLGLDTFTPLDEWTLSESADPGSIGVEVDGTPIPFGEANGYTYDPVTNTVKLHGAALPRPGARITVDYLGLCRP